MTDKKKCRVCANVFTGESLLRLDGMPSAVQNLPAEKNEATAGGVDLDVRQCAFCGLVQLTNDPVPYHKDVIRAGRFSPSMLARQQAEFKKFIERFCLRDKNILEIGSGRGEYLTILNNLPVRAFGLEHNREFNEIANRQGLKTFAGYPTDLDGPPDGMVFDGFISINFLEHAPDPGSFLRASANLLAAAGVGMIAVPDIEFELNDNYLFSFMSDHLSYFSADSLRNLLVINGFDVVDIFRNGRLNVVTAYFTKRAKLDLDPAKEKFDHIGQQINDYLNSILDTGGRIALWGASHLAFSMIAALQIENKIAYIVDSAPFKQGRYAPASGLEIFSPRHLSEDPVDSVMIMCPEYSAEIVAGIKEKYAQVVSNIATFINGGLEIIQ